MFVVSRKLNESCKLLRFWVLEMVGQPVFAKAINSMVGKKKIDFFLHAHAAGSYSNFKIVGYITVMISDVASSFVGAPPV